jgi:hypothetical protein
MNARIYAALFFINIVILVGIATQESVPGYMDADYYYANGLRIANSGSWSEPFIWNYLGDPQSLPHPAFSYWMPLAGIVSAVGIKLSGWSNFWGARIGFILIAGCVAPLTSHLAYTFTPHRWAALLAGGISLFSGFYFAYLPTTETFAIYMVLGSIFFLLVMRSQQEIDRLSPSSELHQKSSNFKIGWLISPAWVYLLMGLVCGLMYLTRIDGIIWFGMGVGVVFTQWYAIKRIELVSGTQKYTLNGLLIPLALFLFSFFLLISPWITRNLFSFGSIFAPGSDRALWLTSYDEIYSYPATKLTSARWLSSGVSELLRARGLALGLNALTSFAVQGGIILLPLIMVGMWVKRNDWRVIFGSFGWLATFLIMTLIFPFQGARGGFFHAGAGFQPLFWALVPVGLVIFTNWAARKRNWETPRALKLFVFGILILVFIMTAFVTRQRLNGSSQSVSIWGETELAYKEVEAFLEDIGVHSGAIVMVNNPPGYYAMTGRQSIAIPDGDLQSSLLAGRDFQASYLVLDKNFPEGLGEIYRNPGDYPGLKYLITVSQMQIYLLEQ